MRGLVYDEPGRACSDKGMLLRRCGVKGLKQTQL